MTGVQTCALPISALQALRLLLGHEPLEARPPAPPPETTPAPVRLAGTGRAHPRVVFFDLETQRSAAEVGGWGNAHLMRVSVAVLHDAQAGGFETFGEGRLPELLAALRRADLVVGYNVRRFDYQVLRGYTSEDLSQLRTFDVLEAIHARLGFRLSLGHLAEETLGAPKQEIGRAHV